jgi:hypothetical protein
VAAVQVMQRQFLRTGITLGSFKLDVATVMAQQGEARLGTQGRLQAPQVFLPGHATFHNNMEITMNIE